MNAHTQTRLLPGPQGALEVAIDEPVQPRAGGGLALIAHPHPLFGGTLHNKVVQTLARAHVQQGWRVLRFNFRGVGGSAGVHDHGVGETDSRPTQSDQLRSRPEPFAKVASRRAR